MPLYLLRSVQFTKDGRNDGHKGIVRCRAKSATFHGYNEIVALP